MSPGNDSKAGIRLRAKEDWGLMLVGVADYTACFYKKSIDIGWSWYLNIPRWKEKNCC